MQEQTSGAPSPKQIRVWQRLRASKAERAAREAERPLWCSVVRMIGGQENGQLVPYELRRASGYRFSARCALDFAGWVALAAVWGHPALVGTQAELAQLLGCSERAVWSAARELEETGWLDIYRPFTPYQEEQGGRWRHVQGVSAYYPGRHLRLAMQMVAAQAAERAFARAAAADAAAASVIPEVVSVIPDVGTLDRNFCDPSETTRKIPEATTHVYEPRPVDKSGIPDSGESKESPVGDVDPSAPTGAPERERATRGRVANARALALAHHAPGSAGKPGEGRSRVEGPAPPPATPNRLLARYVNEGTPAEWSAVMTAAGTLAQTDPQLGQTSRPAICNGVDVETLAMALRLHALLPEGAVR
jgi:hypothetical protein